MIVRRSLRWLCWLYVMLLVTLAGFPQRLCEAAQPLALTPPQGWNADPIGDLPSYLPAGLANNDYLRVTILDRQDMRGVPLLQFLDDFATADAKNAGVLVQPIEQAQGSSPNVVVTSRKLKVNGRQLTAMYVGISVDRERCRPLRITFSGNGELLKTHGTGLASFSSALVDIEKKAAVNDGRGHDMEKIPAAPQGMKPGGKLVPGIYAGNRVKDDGTIRARYRLCLYDNFEYRLLNDKGDSIDDTMYPTFTYDPTTGKLDISVTKDFYNSNSDPDEDKCLYGHDARGKAWIYCFNDRGIGWDETKLYYLGPCDLPSPAFEKAAKAREEAEAARYKFVVKPGEGLKPDQIVGVFHNYEFKYDGVMGSHGVDSVYLVLKDGTIRDGLPVPFDEMDVSLSRRREPEVWGKWKKKGDSLLVAWRDNPDSFQDLKGSWAIRPDDTHRLAGNYTSGSTTGNFVTGSSWSIWGIILSADGTYEKHQRGGMSNGSLAQTLNDAYIFSNYDDEGSSVSASTPGVFVGNTTRKKKGSDRKGTYEINAWTITLRAENGEISRSPFFFTSKDMKSIYFEGASLSISK